VVRDTKILDYLSGLTKEQFSATVYRATSQTLDPIAPSATGGRWMLRDSMAVLYTSIEREGALAELSFYLGMLTPLPSKPMVIHTLEVETKKAIRITRKDFAPLGIDENKFGDIFYDQTQLVGDAAGFLGCDSSKAACPGLVADRNCAPKRDSTAASVALRARRRCHSIHFLEAGPGARNGTGARAAGGRHEG
jgi:RES domain